MECQYCHNSFSNKTSLNTHQRTAKYCLKIQNVEKNTEYICKKCKKMFSTKAHLERHMDICSVNYNVFQLENDILQKDQLLLLKDKEIKELKERIRELEEDMKDVAVTAVSRPTSITNNNQNNILMNLTPFDMNKEKFAEKIREHFNKNYLINGQKGVAQFVVENILKDEEGKLMYICTDPSRQIYRFKGTDGFIERDVKAKKLTTALYDEIRSKSHSISSEEMEGNDSDIFLVYSGRFQDIKELEEDNAEFSIELANLTSK